jgi:hypothetical protein
MKTLILLGLMLSASSAGVFISSISVKNAFVADRFRAGRVFRARHLLNPA